MSASKTKGGRLAWYARRLAAMSPSEVSHRVIERAKQLVDARRSWAWADFAGEDEIAPLPGFDPARAAARLTPAVEAHARAVLDGDIELLSARWPRWRRLWWRDASAWTLDPASGLHWPGIGAAASKHAYRHAHGFGDVKFVWELNRLQFLMPLAVAARRDNDSELAGDILDILQSWMQANPPFQGINWTNGIEAATRLVVALAVNTLLRDAAPQPARRALRQFIAAHAWVLARYPSLFSSANNHRVAELVALFLGQECAPWLDGDQTPIREELELQILRQFHQDGVGAEQSPTYAAYSLEWFLIAAIAGEAAGQPFSSAYRARLAGAGVHLRWLMDDSGRTPAIGDDDEGRVLALGPTRDFRYPAAVCSVLSRWLGDSTCAPPVQPATLLDAMTAIGEGPAETPIGRRTFAEGGYTIWRTPHPRGTLMLAFDHGPLGFLSIAAHGHADALAVWLHVGDEPLIVDAGTYLYHTESDARARFRGTPAHNTLSLDGADQSQISGPFNWSRHAKARLRQTGEIVTADHDGYRASHGVLCVRSVCLDGSVIEITDALEGELIKPTEWSLGYTFHPSATLVSCEGGAEATLPSGARARIAMRFAGDGDTGLRDTQVSPGFGRALPAIRLVARGGARAAGALATTRIELS